MNGQAKGNVFDRYANRRFETDRNEEIAPSADQPDAQMPSSQHPPTEQDTAAREGHSGLRVISNESDEEPLNDGIYKAAFHYKAKARPRLRLHYANGVKVKVLSYAYLIEVVATSHQWLTLVFSSTVVTLKGRHLDVLVEPLQDERIRALVCYRPGVHPEPASGEPCILEIQERGIHQFADEKKD